MQPKVQQPAFWTGWAALCLCALAIPRGYAQTMVTRYHATYSEFDSTRINSPFLLDRSPNWHHVETMNILNTADPVTREDWFQTYMDLQNAQFKTYPARQLTRSVSDLVQMVEGYRENGVQPVGILLKQFHQIRVTDYENNIGYDSIAGRLQFQNYGYQTDNAFAFQSGLLVSHIENDLVRIVVPSEFVFSDKVITSVRIKIPQLEVDQEVAFGEYVVRDAGILPEGINTIGVQIQVKVGMDTYVRNLQLIRALPVEEPDATIANFDFPSRCAFNAPHGYGNARAYIMYHDPAVQRIIKPIIIVEGYDPSSKPYGAITWRTFSTGISYNESGKQVLQQLAKMPELISRLQQEGYDVIAVDFERSGERLEKNAATLAKIIQWVQQETHGGESPVLIGASMGGLMCQAAMNMLSESGCTNCLKAFVSFDSPFHGANVPLGIQELTRFFYNTLFKAQEQYVHKLNTYAAKQMLYYHINDVGERTAWKQTYAGYNKKIADVSFCVSSSSDEGIQHNIADGDEILSWELFNRLTGKEYIDLHVFSKNRFNNMTFQCKVPVSFKKNGTPKNYESTTTYSNFIGPNYDRTPGSSSMFIGEVFELLKEADAEQKNGILGHVGPSAPLGGFHGFVPTVSTIDFYDPNPFADLKNHDFTHPSEITPFDRVFFPATNEFHVLITAENIAKLVSAIQGIDNSLGNVLQGGNSSNFNFNHSPFNVLESVNIKSGGSLHFNTFTKSNYGNLPSDHNPSENLVITRTSYCGAIVSCETLGSLIVGGLPSQSTFHKAHLVFRKNSILELQSDAVLRIRDNSKVVIEEGATLIYHPGAKIYLEGPNAVLEIRGRLQLEQGAVFNFEKGSASQNGFVRFAIPENGNPNVFVTTGNASISLSGNGRTDKIIEIAKGSSLYLPYNPNSTTGKISSFTLENGLIEFTDGGIIDAGCPLNWTDVDLKQLNGNKGTGLFTRGQTSISLDGSHFYNFETGLYAKNTDLNGPLNIDNVRFNNCRVGVESSGQSSTIASSRFWGCGTGLRVESNASLLLNDCDFFYNTVGIEPNGTMGHTRIVSSWFLDNEKGIHDLVSTPISLECSIFELNTKGIVSNGQINMSPSYLLTGQSFGGGNNTFHLNQTGLEFNKGELYLQGGANNFIHSQNSTPQNFLLGILRSNTNSAPNFLLNASGNYFSPIPAQGLGAGSGTLYDLVGWTAANPTNHTIIYLNGTSNSTVNTSCFDLQRFYPNYKSEVWIEAPVYEINTVVSEQVQLKAYPNPTENRIIVETTSRDATTCLIELYDMNGKKVFKKTWDLSVGINKTEINLKDCVEPGIYLLRVNNESRSYPVIRINLQH